MAEHFPQATRMMPPHPAAGDMKAFAMMTSNEDNMIKPLITF